ncbi:MAG: hypothetical protein NC389_08985 [Acetatifactor muris]|nr:hypothetical protein [Acetatifactor muris]
MRNLMKTELYKLKKDMTVWVITLVLVCCAGISIFTGVYDSVENMVLNLGKESMILILACAIYAGFSCTDDFTDRTIIYSVTYGNKRFHILLVKGCRYILGCTAIIISYMAVSMIVSLPVLETGLSLPDLIVYAAKSIILSLPLHWAVDMFFFAIAMLTRKTAMTMGISVAGSILGVVFTNKAYSSTTIPDKSLLRLFPTIQIPMIYGKTFSYHDYKMALIFSIFIILIMFLASAVIFNKAEL